MKAPRGGGVYLFVVGLLLLGRLAPHGADFWTASNLVEIVKDGSILGMVALGLAFVTYSGHFVDLSIPMQMSVAGIVAVELLGVGLLPALVGGLLVGGLIGLLNGLVVGYLKLNPILWTLAAMSLTDGITRWAYGGKWVYVDHETVAGRGFEALYRGSLGGVPLCVLVFAAVAVLAHLVLRDSAYGRQLKLTGAAYEAARLTGVPVRRQVMLAFALSGLTAALAGLFQTSFNKYGDVEIGLGMDFQAITAVVLGGVPLAGGRGTIGGVVGGVLVVALLGRVLPQVGCSQEAILVVRGLLFVVVVGLSQWQLRRSGRDDR